MPGSAEHPPDGRAALRARIRALMADADVAARVARGLADHAPPQPPYSPPRTPWLADLLRADKTARRKAG